MPSDTPNIRPDRQPEYGSDLIVDLMHATGVEYAAFNPGATFRGIHDSIVNYAGNVGPELIQVCHEEVSVAVAHGYAKAAGKPMATICHDTVGLQHASMAIFNAWCDRAPVIVMGGTGPMDATRRRPWIDWVHTALVTGQVVRDYVKWDDQPFSVDAIANSYLRAFRLAMTEPQGPVYLAYDVDLQEQPLASPVPLPDPSLFVRTSRLAPEPAAIAEAAAAVVSAERLVILAGSTGRHPDTIPVLAQLAEALAAPVIDLGARCNFPNTHPLDLSDAREELLAAADVVLALDVPDLFGALRGVADEGTRRSEPVLPAGARVIHISLHELNTRSWSADFEEIPPVHLSILADTLLALPMLLALVQKQLAQAVSGRAARAERATALARRHTELRAQARAAAERHWHNTPMHMSRLAAEVWAAIRPHNWMLAQGPAKGWARRLWDFDKPGQWLGDNAGGGLGYGCGAAIGATLAHRHEDMLCVNLQRDGDLLYTASALWTAAHHRLPLLTVVLNNGTYGNSENHQMQIARTRRRSEANRGIGTYMTNPSFDFAKLAEAQGVQAWGPVTDPAQLAGVLRQAVDYVQRERLPALVDAVVAAG